MLKWMTSTPEVLLVSGNKRYEIAYGSRSFWKELRKTAPDYKRTWAVAAIKLQTWY